MRRVLEPSEAAVIDSRAYVRRDRLTAITVESLFSPAHLCVSILFIGHLCLLLFSSRVLRKVRNRDCLRAGIPRGEHLVSRTSYVNP